MWKFVQMILMTIPFLFAYDMKVGENAPVRIAEYEHDVIGDGNLQRIKLYGILFSPGSAYYQDIYATIQSGDEEWRINYLGGYDPEIQFIDLNHDGILDIFYQSPTGGSGGLNTTRVDTVAKGVLKNIPLPKQDGVKGYFDDGFHAVVEIAPNLKPIVLNVEDRKDDYLRLGIFDEEGKLPKQTSLIIAPIAFFEPVEISKQQGYGLKSYKQISGAYQADQLGVIETLWYFEGNDWIALKTEWKETGEYDASAFY